MSKTCTAGLLFVVGESLVGVLLKDGYNFLMDNRLIDQFIEVSLLKVCPGRGGGGANPGSFGFSLFLFSLSSALDHSATAPPIEVSLWQSPITLAHSRLLELPLKVSKLNL